MAPLERMVLAVASILFLSLQRTSSESEITDGQGRSAKRVSCINEVNAARRRAGLSPGLEEEIELNEDDVEDLEVLCHMLEGANSAELKGVDEPNIMLAPQDGPEADCQTAVEYWEGAGRELTHTPPPYTGDNEAPYNSFERLSFFSLFNPQDSPLLRCALITCPSGAAVTGDSKNGGQERVSVRSSQADIVSGASRSYFLMCISSPPTLVKGQAPFRPDTWGGIAAALKSSAANSASLAFPALVAACLSLFVFV